MSTERDDINTYLTWSNLIKVAVFICSVVWFVARQAEGDTTRDIKLDGVTRSITELNQSMNGLRGELKTTMDVFNSKINLLEKQVDLQSYEIQALKNERK